MSKDNDWKIQLDSIDDPDETRYDDLPPSQRPYDEAMENIDNDFPENVQDNPLFGDTVNLDDVDPDYWLYN